MSRRRSLVRKRGTYECQEDEEEAESSSHHGMTRAKRKERTAQSTVKRRKTSREGE